MPITILDTPRTLCLDADKAERIGGYVELSPERVRRIAEMWFADQEKIAYLESLIVKMGGKEPERRIPDGWVPIHCGILGSVWLPPDHPMVVK